MSLFYSYTHTLSLFISRSLSLSHTLAYLLKLGLCVDRAAVALPRPVWAVHLEWAVHLAWAVHQAWAVLRQA